MFNTHFVVFIALVGQAQQPMPGLHLWREQTDICKMEKHDRKEQLNSHTADIPEQGETFRTHVLSQTDVLN